MNHQKSPSLRRVGEVLLFLLFPLQAAGITIPRWFQPVIQWVDEADSIGCDTAYVRLAKEGFIGYVNLLGAGTMAHASVGGREGSALTTPTSSALSLSVAYRGWGLSYAFHDDTRWHDDDFSFSFNSRRYGLDYRYHSSHALHPFSGGDLDGMVGEGRGRMRTTSATAYWVFQRSRFSHPGAMLHTTYQLRSAGSVIAGANYWHGSYTPSVETPGLDVSRLSLSHLNVGCGYAYNFVFGHQHCLLHASLIPMVNVWHRNRVYDSSAQASRLHQQFSADAVSRLGFVYHQGRCLTGVQYTFDYSYSPCEERLTLHNFDWGRRFFVGMRF